MIAAATRATSTTISDEPVAQTGPALRSRFSIDNTNHLDVSMVEKSHSVIISLREQTTLQPLQEPEPSASLLFIPPRVSFGESVPGLYLRDPGLNDEILQIKACTLPSPSLKPACSGVELPAHSFCHAHCWNLRSHTRVPFYWTRDYSAGIGSPPSSFITECHNSLKFLGKWMDLEGIILSEVTHSQRNSHNMYSLISGY